MQRGFSLPETLVVIAILVVVGLALSSAIQFFYRGNAYVLEQTSAVEIARRGVTVGLQNLREASYGDDGSFPITSAGTSTVTFHADVDGDAGIERVRLFLEDGTFYRGITNAGGSPLTYDGQPEAIDTVTPNVRNTAEEAIFTYTDSTGALLSAPVNTASITSVGMLLKIDINPDRAPNIYTLSGSATVRNLLIDA